MEIIPFHPPVSGVWTAEGLHYVELEWYDLNGWYTCAGCLLVTDNILMGPTSDPATVPCTVPKDERAYSLGWKADQNVFHEFGQELLFQGSTPVTYSGRIVTEHTDTGAFDSCHFVGSIFDPQVTLLGGSWPVSGNNTWQKDTVGWAAEAIFYYRAQRALRGLPVACESSIPQKMTISCPGASEPPYVRHTNRAMMDELFIGVQKGDVLLWQLWP